MRIAQVVAAALAFSLAGCAFPRIVVAGSAPSHSVRCEIEGAPPEGSMMFATVRLPDCSGPQLKMTDVRSPETLYGALSNDGSVRLYHAAEWWPAIKKRLSPAHPPLLFIHGYNTDNRDALDDALAIRMAIGGNHEVIAFTWPSYASIPKYFWDETNAEWAEAGSRELTTELAGTGRLTVLGHSMGNHLALDAVTQLPRSQRAEHIVALIMASPDVDRAEVRRTLEQRIGVPVTLYGSTRDQALSGSWRLHGLPRAGDLATWVSGNVPDYALADLPDADVVDTSAVTTGLLHHSDYIDTAEGAADLCRVVGQIDPKTGREAVPGHPGRWVLRRGGLGDACASSGSAAYQWLARKSPKRRR